MWRSDCVVLQLFGAVVPIDAQFSADLLVIGTLVDILEAPPTANVGARPANQFDGTLDKRFLEGNRLGALISGSYDWNGRGINDIEPGPALAGTYDLAFRK